MDGQGHQSPECVEKPPLPPHWDPSLEALQLTEALRALLEGQECEEKQEALRKQVSHDTASVVLEWLQRTEVSLSYPNYTTLFKRNKKHTFQHKYMEYWETVENVQSSSNTTESTGFISYCLILVINIWRLFSSLLRKELEAGSIVNTKGNEIQNSCLKHKQFHFPSYNLPFPESP